MADETPVVAPAPVVKSSGSGSLIKTIVIILLTNATCAGTTWFIVHRAMAPQEKPAAAGAKPREQVDMAAQLEKSAVIPLEPFVVNLADADAARYLRIRVTLMVDDKSKLKAVEENQALQLKMRDLILQTLTRKTSEDLKNDEGKNKLRQEIQNELNPFFKAPKLNEVMFTEFVVQL